jgi:DNA-binding transcriptional LysR family regulator
MLALNDEAATRLRGLNLQGWVRLGVQEDFGEDLLPRVLARFAASYPKVRVEARVSRHADLVDRLASGRLDLALVWGDAGGGAPDAEPKLRALARLRMRWIRAASSRGPAHEPGGPAVSLLAFERPCAFRDEATAALDRAGIPWRVAFTSASLSGLFAAAAAGLGVTVRTGFGLRRDLRPLGRASGLPRLPAIQLALARSTPEPTPAAARLGAIVIASLKATLRA